MTLLAVKLLLGPALVVAASLASRRWGPGIGGLLVALPVIAGPILLIVALEQGPQFAARASASALLGVAGLAAYAMTGTVVSGVVPWPVTVMVGWAGALVVDVVALELVPPLPVVVLLAVTLVVVAAANVVSRAVPGAAPPPGAARRWWDLPARGLAAAALTMGLTLAAAALGPVATGILAPFPVASTILLAFTLSQDGVPAARAALGGLSRGLVAFATFCGVVSATVIPWGTTVSFTVGLLAALGVQAIVRWSSRRLDPIPTDHLPVTPSRNSKGSAEVVVVRRDRF